MLGLSATLSLWLEPFGVLLSASGIVLMLFIISKQLRMLVRNQARI
jgi:hypothetical protein